MFELDWGKLVIIGIVALIAIGPKELPTVLRTLGLWMGKIKRMANEFQGQFQDALREAEMGDLKKQADDLKSTVGNFTNFDPLAETPKASDPVVAPASPAETAQVLPPVDVPRVDVAPPAEPGPVTEKDFAAAESPPKQAGGNA
jgi:sec-independent protein translocase protein TatB